MNIKGYTFDIFYVPHSNKWSVIVKDRGVRMAAPFLIECGSTIDEACTKLTEYCRVAVMSESLGEMMNSYENRHRRDAG